MDKTNIINKIGNTPIVRLREIEKIFNMKNELYIKLENTNPTGSIKDRACKKMLEEYIKEGKVNKDTIIIEATSGNMGISLSALCKEYNIECHIVMPSSMSKERREMIASYGAKLILVDGGMSNANEKVKRLVASDKRYLWFDQFNNINNALAHYKTTAREIEKDLKDVDYMFICFGSTGTISGISSYYKDKGYKTKFIGIEPEESPLLTKGYACPHKIQGIGANFIPSIMKRDNIEKIITVKEEEAIKMAQLLHEEEDLFVGISSGANVLGMVSYLLSEKIENKKVLTLAMDKGDRYSW